MDLAAGHIRSVLSKLSVILRELEECGRPAEGLMSLARELRRLPAFVEHVPLGQVTEYKLYWVNRIRKLFYDVENLVDYSYLVPAAADQLDGGGFRRLFRKKKSRQSSLNPSHEIAGGMEVLAERAAGLFGELVRNGQLPAAPYNQEEEQLVGMDSPKDALIQMLARPEMKRVSVSGVAGSGKSALAHTVYRQLKPQFECGAFVVAPLDSDDMLGFLTDMLHQLLGVPDIVADEQRRDERHLAVKQNLEDIHPSKDKSEDILRSRKEKQQREHDKIRLASQIAEFLQDKRYLIVIDNLWNEEDWDIISDSLPDNAHDSRVITTTRVFDIAILCSVRFTDSIYVTQYLGYEDSRELFLRRFFGYDVSFSNAPKDVFKEIMQMCGGTPSAIIIIASFLARKVTATKPWQEMQSSIYSAWKQTASSLQSGFENISGFEDLRHIISLTYLNLPNTLKDCLLYMAIHAKDRIIHRTSMVRKWIAEGFIFGYGQGSPEEVANWYFDELIERNFIEMAEHGNYSGEEIYEVNNVVLYVLRLISQEIKFATVLSDVGMSSEDAYPVRRLSIQCSGSNQLVVHTEKMDLSGIRSITIVGPAKFSLNNNSMMYLRVLDLDGCKDLDNSIMGHICRMFLLKYLGLKKTHITEIPPEIGKLLYLETLDIRQNGISRIPPEIGKLQELKSLDASHTRISFLPPEIRLLQNLETLDVRQTQLKELPKEVSQLPKLAHLYFGQSTSSPLGVKLPAGSDQLQSLEVLGTVDSREWSASAIKEISGLEGVRELQVVLHDRPSDKEHNDKLLSSIGNYPDLEYLIIDGDYNPSNGLQDVNVTPYFPRLERMKVAGRFVKVPQWITHIGTLRKLDIRVCKLDQDDLKILASLTSLSTLALALISLPRKEQVTIPSRLHSSKCTCTTKLWRRSNTLPENHNSHDSAGQKLHIFPEILDVTTDLQPPPSPSQASIPLFHPPSTMADIEKTCPACFTSLEVFSFDCHVPWINFEKGAMSRLKRLHMKLYACRDLDKLPSGIINLPSLEKIILRYSSHYASSSGVMKAVDAIKEEAASLPNLIDFSINGNNDVFIAMRKEKQKVKHGDGEYDQDREDVHEMSKRQNNGSTSTNSDAPGRTTYSARSDIVPIHEPEPGLHRGWTGASAGAELPASPASPPENGSGSAPCRASLLDLGMFAKEQLSLAPPAGPGVTSDGLLQEDQVWGRSRARPTTLADDNPTELSMSISNEVLTSAREEAYYSHGNLVQEATNHRVDKRVASTEIEECN